MGCIAAIECTQIIEVKISSTARKIIRKREHQGLTYSAIAIAGFIGDDNALESGVQLLKSNYIVRRRLRLCALTLEKQSLKLTRTKRRF